MQALYALALSPIAETKADPHSYGFRPNRSVADAILQCQNVLAQKNRAKWILEGDIKACFDQISHQWLLEHIPMDKFILSQWLESGFMENNTFFHTKEGTPQGGIVSPILANMVLDGLQETIKRVSPRRTKVNFVRYADDFICTAADPDLLRDTIKPAIEAFLGERGLSLSQEKTHITHIDDGFDFLGFNLRKYNGKFRAKPSKGNIKSFRAKLKDCCRQLRFRQTHNVIASLNRTLRGWGNFYRFLSTSKLFGSLNHYLFETIWRELKRRHPKKSGSWKKRTYFTSKGGNNWVFFGTEKEKPKKRKRTQLLFQLGSLHHRRHIKLKSDATPFDPAFKAYLAKRSTRRVTMRLRDQLYKFLTTSEWVPTT